MNITQGKDIIKIRTNPKTNRGRKVVEKEDIADDIKLSFDKLNEAFKEAGYELVIRRPVSKELVMFDYGLLFTQGTNEIQVYVDDDLKLVIDHLLTTNKQVLIKCNWMSPDTVAINVPLESSTIVQDGSGRTEASET